MGRTVITLLLFISLSDTTTSFDVKQYDPRRHKPLPVSTQTNKQHSTAIHVVWDKAVKPEEWAKVVMDKDKNVVVWFTSPWSGHCKRFGPTFEALARAHAKKEATTRTPFPGAARPACPRVTDSAVLWSCKNEPAYLGFCVRQSRRLPKHGARKDAWHSVLPDHQIFPKRAQGRPGAHRFCGRCCSFVSFPNTREFPSQASSKLNTKKANHGGELYHGELTVQAISKFIQTANFLERFKPPPPPPPAPWHSWITGAGTESDDDDNNGAVTSTSTMDWGGGVMTETSTETISFGPNGEMMIEETFSFRL